MHIMQNLSFFIYGILILFLCIPKSLSSNTDRSSTNNVKNLIEKLVKFLYEVKDTISEKIVTSINKVLPLNIYKMFKSSGVKITRVTGPSEMGEGPFWDDKNQSLYYIDMWKQLICKYTPHNGKTTCAKVPGDKPVLFVFPITDSECKDKFIIGYGNSVAKVTWDGTNKHVSNLEIMSTIDPDPTNRLNDAKISPSGVLFAGSMGSQLPDGSYPRGAGGFFKYSGNKVVKVLSNLNIPNGIAWTTDEKTMYLADSDDYKIYKFEYDAKSAALSERSVFSDFKQDGIEGFPDGLTIDEENNIWVATFKGKSIVCLEAGTGKLLRTINIPAPQATSVTFGGPRMDILYVTTAKFQIEDDSDSGVYKVENLGIRGAKSVPFNTN